MEKGKVKLR